MIDLPETVIDEIFERSLKAYQKVYCPDYVKFLMKSRKLTSVFDLFDKEKRKNLSAYKNLVRNHHLF